MSNEAVEKLVAITEARTALGADLPGPWTKDALAPGPAVYANQNERLNIDFTVERLGFPEIQTMDPRVVRIAPGKNNERHKHAHETLFVILEGEGEVLVGKLWGKVKKGDVAFVPRWIFHQTKNTSLTNDLVVLAITDFGFTSAVLGDYDARTRLANKGADVVDEPG